MKKTSKTIPLSGANKGRLVFFGNERLATGVTTTAPTLRALLREGYEVLAVVSNYERGVSRSGRSLEIEVLASQYNVPFLLPKRLSDIHSELAALNADAGVLVAYGKMVPESIIKLFRHGIINIHPSDLPLHRGPTPVESVILEGSQTTAVSIMQLVKGMDAGPLYAKQQVTLTGLETKQELANLLLDAGSELIIQSLPDILSGKLHPTPQDETRASYDSLISKNDGTIDWNKSAVRIEREIRAYAGWPKSRTRLASIDVIVTAAHVLGVDEQISNAGHVAANTADGSIHIATTEGTLAIDRLKPAGKNEMDSASFLAGYGRLL